MYYISFGALTLCYYICAFLLFRKNVHMFQLNGYKHPVHKKWIKDNLEELLLRSVWALGAVLLVKKWGDLGCFLAAALFLIVAGLNLPKKAKKPLVFTARVKRLCLTFLLIGLIPVLFGFFAP